MGFWDDMDNLFDIVKDIVFLPVEIVKMAVECGNSIGEAVGQDISNTITGNAGAEIKTSYDIKEEADKIIEKANMNFYDARESLRKEWGSFSTESKRVADMRAQIYTTLGLFLTAKEFLPLPDNSSIIPEYPTCQTMDNLTFDVGTLLGAMGTETRMEVAKEYLSNAKDYKNEIADRISKMNIIKKSSLAAKQSLTEEAKMLEVIQSAYKIHNDQILDETTSLLYQISVECLNDVNDHTNQRYEEILQKLKSLWY